MSIKIKHRFYDRLKPAKTIQRIDILIIGTFNPGNPEINLLNSTELNHFKEIESKSTYQSSNSINNFYDRPRNRFWKIMDIINSRNFYKEGNLKLKNPNGLKFYNGMNRTKVLNNQKTFCEERNIFITDLVKEITPLSFFGIYDQFSDKILDESNCTFSTDEIIEIISDFNPKTIISTFQSNYKTIPNISKELQKIKTSTKREFSEVLSPSGAKRYTYEQLIDSWLPKFDPFLFPNG